MQHCTPEQLALAALAEPLPADDAAHLAACAVLPRRGRLPAARRRRPRRPRSSPPPERRFPRRRTSGPRSPRPPGSRRRRAPSGSSRLAPRRSRRAGAGRTRLERRPAASAPVAHDAADRRGLGRGRRGRSAPARWPSCRAATTTVPRWRAAALDPLDDADASGTAEVVERDDGTRVLEVDLDAPAPTTATTRSGCSTPDVIGTGPGRHRPGRHRRRSSCPPDSTSTSTRSSTSRWSRWTATPRTPASRWPAGQLES